MPRHSYSNLFQLGKDCLHSGEVSDFKIECDALTDADLDCIAYLLAKRLPAFGSVDGIPNGGLALASKLQQYASRGPRLIVDDVLTTGTSMRAYRDEHDDAIGAVIFSRGTVPSWVTALFTMSADA